METVKIDFNKFDAITTKMDKIVGGEVDGICYSGRGIDGRDGSIVEEWCISHDDGSWHYEYY